MSKPDKDKQITVIIPCRIIEPMALKCVEKCREHTPDAQIILIPNTFDEQSLPTGLINDPKTHVIGSDDIWIGAKRNMGARLAQTKYLGFIDSDAYPDERWALSAMELLSNDESIGAVGGPNISPLDQPYIHQCVGNAGRSMLVAGPWAYRKQRGGQGKECLHTPSCNMIVRHKDYLAVGGMDETLITGEDVDFTNKIRSRLGKTIYFDPDTIVFHHDKSLKNFIAQKLCFGASVRDIPLRTLISQLQILQLAPMLFILTLAALLALSFFSPLALQALLLLVSGYLLACTFEAVRFSRHPSQIPMTLITICLGNLLPGLGMLAHGTCLLPDRKSIYLNYDVAKDNPGTEHESR